MLTHSAAKVVAQYLIDAGLGIPSTGSGNWKVYANTIPSEGDRIIAVTNTGAVTDGRLMRTGALLKHHSVQVFVRSPNDPKVAGSKLEVIEDSLSKNVRQTLVTIAGTTYLFESFNVTIPTAPIGQEEQNRRFRYVMSGNATIQEV